jgi:hypothetical protein
MNRNVITATRAGRLIDWMAGESSHAKRVQSVTNAVVGVVNAVLLSTHAIGAGLAQTTGLNAKHAIKQVDRLLSNSALNVWALFDHWVPDVVGARTAIVVALDWTDFDADGHSTIALYLVGGPGVWRPETVRAPHGPGLRLHHPLSWGGRRGESGRSGARRASGCRPTARPGS